MRVIVFAPAVLHRDAWLALLSGQPGIEPAGGVAAVDELSPLLVPPGSTAVLIDLPAPDPDLIRGLRAAAPEAGLIVLVPAYDLPLVVELLQAGATGVLSTAEGAGELSRGLIAAGRGEIVLPPEIAARALSALARGERGEGGLVEPLSEREGEVLRWLGQGLTNKDIAQTLMLSVRTVEAHLRNIYGKLGVRSRTEAALWAVRHGYGGGR